MWACKPTDLGRLNNRWQNTNLKTSSKTSQMNNKIVNAFCSVLIIHVPILIIDNNLSMGSKVSTLYLIQ